MKTVLINGGSRGIGKATVEYFASHGYAVAFTYKNSKEEAEALAKRTGALAIMADSAKEDDVLRAVKTTIDAFSHIDVLINNAAISSFSVFCDISLDEWEEIFRVNVTGPFLYSRAVLSHMISRKCGSIVNVSSMWGLVGSSCEVHYSTTKAALIGMTKALAKEVGPSGIRVNAIAPGVIATEMNQTLSEEDMTSLTEETPLCRIGTPEEIARAIYFLASEEGSFITGEVLNASGGFVI
jgi:3-oxoacyl-[acyl-carrier protein] reductase